MDRINVDVGSQFIDALPRRSITLLLMLLLAFGTGVRLAHAEHHVEKPDLEAKAAQEADNRVLVRRWLSELWDEGDYAVAKELLAADFRRHSAGFPATGPDAYAAIVKSCHDGFPDTEIAMVDEPIADGDRVFVRWRWTGTHEAEFRGIAATGRRIDVFGEDVLRIRDGRITDIWPLFDPLRLMLQIGALAPTGTAE